MSVERDPPPDAHQRAAALAGGSALVRVPPKPIPDAARAAFTGALQRAAAAPRTLSTPGQVRPEGRAVIASPASTTSSAHDAADRTGRTARERAASARERDTGDRTGRERTPRETSRAAPRGGEERTRTTMKAEEEDALAGDGASVGTSAREPDDDGFPSLAFAAREGFSDTPWPSAVFAALPDARHVASDRSPAATTRSTLAAPLDGAALASLLERLSTTAPGECDAWHFTVLGGAGEIESVRLQWSARAGWRVQLTLRGGREPDEAALESIEAELRARLDAGGHRLERLGFVPAEVSGE